MTCIGVPVSWLRLEQLALGAEDPAAREHCEECAVCRGCLDEIRGDTVALPALVVPDKRRRWVWLAVPALAAAAIAVIVLRPRPEDRVTIKGVGEVIVDVVRERDGAITDGARSYRPGDRWKVVVTCPPTHEVSLAVAIREDGADHADRPLAPTKILCGNRIYVPGAFELTGGKPHRVCVRIEDQADACLTLAPE